jgi:hypothetical protein
LSWPKKDKVSWVEWRLREWESVKSGRRNDPHFAAGLPNELDLRIWLAKEREGHSWQEIANKYLRGLRLSKPAAISAVRRAHDRIENAIAPSKKQLLYMSLDSQIRRLFGCSPDEFRKYLRRK